MVTSPVDMCRYCNGPRFHVSVTYEYWVGDQPFTGRNLRFGSDTFDTRQDAQQAVDLNAAHCAREQPPPPRWHEGTLMAGRPWWSRADRPASTEPSEAVPPNTAILERLSRMVDRDQVFSISDLGAITFLTDGRHLWVQTEH